MTGSLQKKNNKYYAVVGITDETGKRKLKWVNTGVKVAGNNKREANKRLREILAELETLETVSPTDTLFVEWIETWLAQKKFEIRLNTWEAYELYVKKHIVPYFSPLKLMLKSTTPQHIQDFYNKKTAEGLNPASVKKYNVVINGAFREALKKNLIPYNPIDRVTLPTMRKFEGKAYTPEQAQKLLAAITDEPMESVIKLTLFYGLRRSEVLGLRWQDINFDENTMRICNTVVKLKTQIEHERTKSSASRRTLYLTPEIKAYLQILKQKQDKNRKLMGRSYHDGIHVCTWADGRPFARDYVSQRFRRILEVHGLPRIRFHELRHTTGSMLMERGMMVKQISEFLGHEKVATTLDIYGHLSIEGKKETASAMGDILKFTASSDC